MMQNDVTNTGVKIFAVWTAYGVSSWTEAAGFLAFILSALALGEWLWKKLFRPMAEYAGWIKPLPRRRKTDEDESE